MIRVLLVDDHERFRAAVQALLEQAPDFAVVGTVAAGQWALDLLAAGLAVDVMVTDLRMPGLDGIETTRRALALRPGLRVLALSSFDDPVLVAAMAAAGGCGFVRKGDPLEELLRALRVAASGSQGSQSS